MKLPWVSRERLEEIRRDKDLQIAKLEHELHRIKDLIFLNSFNVQIHDTILPKTEAKEEAKETVQEETEESTQDRREEIKNRLRVVARTRPSQMGSAVAAAMAEDNALAMKELHPAKQVFAEAQKEVEQNVPDMGGVKVNED